MSNNRPEIELDSVVLDCPDIEALSGFYIRLLGWEKHHVDEYGYFLSIRSPKNGAKISFQCNHDYVPPIWPEEPGKQQQMLHLDFAVKNKAAMAHATDYAISLGAKKAGIQYSDEWTVLFDPVGHPFCFVV